MYGNQILQGASYLLVVILFHSNNNEMVKFKTVSKYMSLLVKRYVHIRS